MPPGGCPSPAELADFHAGRLADDRIDVIGRHLDFCTQCLGVASPSTLDHAPPTDYDREAGCQLARHLVERIPGSGLGVGERVGDFRLIRELGRGGMGVVYEAEQLSLGRLVAVKLVLRRGATDPDLMKRFEREAKAVGRLHHTNIVPVFGVGEYDGGPFYAMQLIRGVGLNEVIDAVARRRRGEPAKPGLAEELARGVETGDYPSDPSHVGPPASSIGPAASSYWHRAAGLVAQAAAGMGYAHDQGVLHRDIKPSNLLLDTHGTVWVTDFGLAKTDDAADLTHTGDLLGTLRYMPPEAFDGKTDRRADVYALGLTLYELLALRPAFTGADRAQVMRAVMTADPPRLRDVAVGIPRDLETVVAKAIDRDPGRRYQTGHALADDLRRFVRDEPIRARRIGPAEQFVRWAKHNRGLAAALAGLLLTLIGVTVGSLVAAGQFRQLASEQSQLAASEGRLRQEQQELATSEAKARAIADAARDAGRRDLYHAETSLAVRAADTPGGLGRLADHCRRWTPAAGEPDLRGWEWRLLHRMANPFRHALEFQDGAEAVAYSPDGRTLAVGRDGRVALLDADTAEPRAEWPAGDRMVTSLAWDGAGRRLLVGSDRGTVRVLDAGTGRCDFERSTTQPAVFAWDATGERIAYLAAERTIRVVRVRDGAEEAVLTGVRVDGAGAFAFAPDGRRFAATVHPGTRFDIAVRVWDATRWTPLRTLPETNLRIGVVAWSTDGTRVAAGNVVGTVLVWNPDTGAVVRELEANGHHLSALQWSRDDKHLSAGDHGGGVRVWEVATWEAMPACRGMPGAVRSLSWRPDGSELAAGGLGHAVRVWPMNELSGDRTFSLGARVPNTPYLSCAWHPDGRRLTGSTANIGTRLWDAGGRVGFVQGIQWGWSHDGRLGASGFSERIEVRDQTGKVVAKAELPGQPKWLAWHPTADRLLVRVGKRVYLWEPTSGRPPELVSGPPNLTGSIDFAPGGGLAWNRDGTRFAVGRPANDGTWGVVVVDPLAQTAARQVGDLHAMIRSVVWSPDGAALAVAGDDPAVSVFDQTSGALLRRLAGHAAAVHAVAYHPDGTRLATGAADGTVKVWDTATGVPVVTFDVGSVVHHLAWSQDGTGLAAAAADGTVRVWVARGD